MHPGISPAYASVLVVSDDRDIGHKTRKKWEKKDREERKKIKQRAKPQKM